MVDQLDAAPSSASVSLAEACRQLGSLDFGAEPLTAIVHAVTRIAVSTIPGVAEVSVTIITVPDEAHTTAFSGSLAAMLDERQYEEGFGPCLTVARAGGSVRLDDTATDASFPDFAAVARRQRVGSAMAISLPMSGGTLGAIGLYSSKGQGPISSQAEAVAAMFGLAAGVTLANASLVESLQRRGDQLEAAMVHRGVIEQAKGMVMMTKHCDGDEAFRLIARLSQRTNRKLRDVATDTVTAGARGEQVDLRTLSTGRPDRPHGSRGASHSAAPGQQRSNASLDSPQ